VKIDAAASAVWRAITDPAMLSIWMLDDRGKVESDWTAGAPVRITSRINGKYESKGTVLEVIPRTLLRYSSWTRISRLPDKPENYSTVEFRLMEERQSTVLQLINANLIAEAAFEHSNFYWGIALQELKKLVEGSQC
jgi:uncharacterized protein YndB with AHSA1/START domain